MSFVAAAIGGVVGGIGSLLGGQAQAGAANNATSAQQGMFEQIQGNMQPYMQAGTGALSQLQGYLNSSETGGPNGSPGLLHQFGAQDLNANLAPNYQFQLGQGMGQLSNQNAASGGAGGGNAFAGEQAYAQNMAGSAYQNAYNNYQNNQNAIYSRLGNLAQLGQSSGTNSALGGSAFGQGIASTMVGVGNAQAAGYTGIANAANGAAGNIGGYYMAQNFMNPSIGGGYGLGSQAAVNNANAAFNPQTFVGPTQG